MSASTKLDVYFNGIDRTGAVLNRMQGGLRGFALKAAGALGGAFAVGSIVRHAGEVIKQLDEIEENSNRIGMSTESYQKLSNAFKMLGMEAGDVDLKMKFMRRNIAAKGDLAGNIFQQMGMDIGALKGMGAEDQFKAIGKAIAGLPNEMDRVKAATAIFGKSAQDLVPLFRAGPDGFISGLEGVMNMMPIVSDSITGNLGNVDDAFKAIQQQTFVDFANGLGALGSVGEQSFGRIDVAIYRSYQWVRMVAKNWADIFSWVFDYIASMWESMLSGFDINNKFEIKPLADRIQENMKQMDESVNKFAAGTAAKEKLTKLFDPANQGASILKGHLKEIKEMFSTFTLAGSYAAMKAQFSGMNPMAGGVMGGFGGIPVGANGAPVAVPLLSRIAVATEKLVNDQPDFEEM